MSLSQSVEAQCSKRTCSQLLSHDDLTRNYKYCFRCREQNRAHQSASRKRRRLAEETRSSVEIASENKDPNAEKLKQTNMRLDPVHTGIRAPFQAVMNQQNGGIVIDQPDSHDAIIATQPQEASSPVKKEASSVQVSHSYCCSHASYII